MRSLRSNRCACLFYRLFILVKVLMEFLDLFAGFSDSFHWIHVLAVSFKYLAVISNRHFNGNMCLGLNINNMVLFNDTHFLVSWNPLNLIVKNPSLRVLLTKVKKIAFGKVPDVHMNILELQIINEVNKQQMMLTIGLSLGRLQLIC